jgi:hypothetical protein
MITMIIVAESMEQRGKKTEKPVSVRHLTDLPAFEGREESKSIRGNQMNSGSDNWRE